MAIEFREYYMYIRRENKTLRTLDFDTFRAVVLVVFENINLRKLS